ncbi:MAG TPA: hypothetical protein VJ836_07205 [Candidatus Saccharimonadales bacterium]|nr:hypothetical protein [Candidatus Saccharimonadales bacterium]
MRLSIKLLLNRLLLIVIALVIMGGTLPLQSVSAQDSDNPDELSNEDIQSILGPYSWYDEKAEECEADTSDAGGGAGTDAGIWNSGLQSPYILEQFMVELLKAIAAKRGVDPSKTVTEEHVVALVAFAMGEGGDINNRFLFNPLNTGIKVPDLLAPGWEHNPSGLQAFKSFDAGVEANARVMTGPNQNRMADILTKQNSTAEQFMEAVTYFKRYPGNKIWAEASIPSEYNNFDPNAPEKYFRSRLQLIKQVRNNWNGTAALVIGTQEFEQKTGRTIPSKLQFHPSGRDTNPDLSNRLGSTAGLDCPGETANGPTTGRAAILAKIIEYSWPDYRPAGDRDAMTRKREYAKAIRDHPREYRGSCNGIDCGAFVTRVMRDSGADKSYNKSECNTLCQMNYLRNNSGPGKKYHRVQNSEKLEPGDIAVQNNGFIHHTFFYVGKLMLPNGKRFGGDAASASQCERAPMASPNDTRRLYEWYRLN